MRTRPPATGGPGAASRPQAPTATSRLVIVKRTAWREPIMVAEGTSRRRPSPGRREPPAAPCYSGPVNSAPESLRVFVEPELDGATHMQRDRELLESHLPGMPTCLRLYTWSPPAISLGSMQDAARLLDLEACRAAGIDVVQRPTGGRAILHWEEITYAIVASADDARFGGHVATSHAVIGRCLAAGLERLGVRATLSRPALDPERRLLRQPCFASPGRAELLVGGRKLLGSAQRRTASAFLQHGSLLLGPAHERLVDFLLDTERDPALAATMRDKLRRDTVTLGDLLGAAPSFETLVEVLVHGFARTLELTVERAPIPRDARSGAGGVRPGRGLAER